jgi:hypothetical protein
MNDEKHLLRDHFEDIKPTPPKTCPACKMEFPIGIKPAYFLISDRHLPCGWVIVKGWTCDELFGDKQKMVFGTAVRRGDLDDPKNFENAVYIEEKDCTYIMGLPGRKLEMVWE